MDGYHSNTDGNLTLTHTGTTEFAQLSPALKKIFLPDLLMFFPSPLNNTHTHTHTQSGPKTFTYFRGNNIEPKRMTTTVAGKSSTGNLYKPGNLL